MGLCSGWTKDPVTGKRKQISRRGKTKSAAAKKVQEALASLKDFGVDEKIAEKNNNR